MMGPRLCSWALRGKARQKFTEQATHIAHQGCWTVPRAKATLALSPDSEDSTIWLPSCVRRPGITCLMILPMFCKAVLQ